MSRALLRLATAGVTLVVTSVLALGQPGCMLITSPGDFSIVDASIVDAGRDTGKTCPADGGTSCETCVAKSCCSSLLACQEDPKCVLLLQCASGDTSCIKDNSSAAKLASAFLDCSSKECKICSQAGVGDSCGQGAATCLKGLTCTGLWCTKSCAGDADCAGSHPNGLNSSGTQNRCAINGEEAAVCFPGCSMNTDCAVFPDTSCYSDPASGGGMTDVCAANESDAGEEGGFTDAGSDDGSLPDAAGTADGGADASHEARPDAHPKDAHAG